jgi:hypothetical protein
MPFRGFFFKNNPDAKMIANLIINSNKQKNLNFVESMALSNLKLKFLMNGGNPKLSLSELKFVDKIIQKIEKTELNLESQ